MIIASDETCLINRFFSNIAMFFTFFSFAPYSDTTRIEKLKNSIVNQTQNLFKKTKIWKTQAVENPGG